MDKPNLEMALISTTDKLIRARDKCARLELALQGAQTGIRRLKVRYDDSVRFIEDHQMLQVMREDERVRRLEASLAWFKQHPEDVPEGWFEKRGLVPEFHGVAVGMADEPA